MENYSNLLPKKKVWSKPKVKAQLSIKETLGNIDTGPEGNGMDNFGQGMMS